MIRPLLFIAIATAMPACSGPPLVAPVSKVAMLSDTARAGTETLRTACGDITVTRNGVVAGGGEEILISRAGGGATAKVIRHPQRVETTWQPAITSRLNPIAQLSAQQPMTNLCRVSAQKELSTPFQPGPLSQSFGKMQSSGWISPFKLDDPETPLMQLRAVTPLSVRRHIRFVPIIGTQLNAALKDDACTAVIMLAVAASQILEIQTGIALDVLPPLKFGHKFIPNQAGFDALKKLADGNPARDYHVAHLIEESDALDHATGDAFVGGACGDHRAEAYSLIPKGSPADGINVLVHEILHQFNARHSQVDQNDTKLAQWQFEPGKGTSVMSWTMSERYLHAATVDQVAGFFANNSCGGESAPPAAQAPKIDNAGLSFTVPSGTPFELSTAVSGASCVRWHEWDQASKDLPWFRSFESCHATRMMPSHQAIQSPQPDDRVIAGKVSMRFVAMVNSGRDDVNAGLVLVTSRAGKTPFAVISTDTSCATSAQACIRVSWNGALTRSKDAVVDVMLEGSLNKGKDWIAMGPAGNADGVTTAEIAFNEPKFCGNVVDLRLKAVKGIIFATAPKPIKVC